MGQPFCSEAGKDAPVRYTSRFVRDTPLRVHANPLCTTSTFWKITCEIPEGTLTNTSTYICVNSNSSHRRRMLLLNTYTLRPQNTKNVAHTSHSYRQQHVDSHTHYICAMPHVHTMVCSSTPLCPLCAGVIITQELLVRELLILCMRKSLVLLSHSMYHFVLFIAYKCARRRILTPK